MRTLYEGLQGDDVVAWEQFLLGANPACSIVVDGKFTLETKDATKEFQRSVGFFGKDIDGVVGPLTYAKAMLLGFDPLSRDDRSLETGPNWPPRPVNGPLPFSQRVQTFGQFSFKAAPTSGNPEGIIITDGWEKKNIVTIHIPQLALVNGAPSHCNIQLHRLVAPQIKSLFLAWESANLMQHVLTWGGSWAPRFIRGSRTVLSNHAWGTAFDINVQWNMLGSRPALKGQKGSVRDLVEIAYDHGMYWGGWFGYAAPGKLGGRSDGMHFETQRVI